MSVILESETPLLFSKEGPGVVGQLLMLTTTVEFSITILEPPLNIPPTGGFKKMRLAKKDVVLLKYYRFRHTGLRSAHLFPAKRYLLPISTDGDPASNAG